MKKFKLIMIGLFISCFMATYQQAPAQLLQDMTFMSYTGTYVPITGNYWSYPYTVDDAVWSMSLPFSFKYNNSLTSVVYFSSNGYILFPPYGNYSYYWSYYVNELYACMNAMRRDLYVYGGIYVNVDGAAPNRVWTIQWNTVDFYYGYSANMNFQIKLNEGSNIPQMVYGSMSRGSYNFSPGSYWTYAHCGWSNSTYYGAYIQAIPGNPFTFYKGSGQSSQAWGSVNSNAGFANFYSGLTLQLTAYPSYSGTYPRAGSILMRGGVYTGAQHPAVFCDRIVGQASAYFTYSISGPMPASSPDYKEIYRATAIGNPTDPLHGPWRQPLNYSLPYNSRPDSVHITYATGLAAWYSGDADPTKRAALDLSTNQNSIPGGEYVLQSTMILPGASNYTQALVDQSFNIALMDDFSSAQIVSPRSKDATRYPQTQSQIAVQLKTMNVGYNDVTSFDATAKIWYSDGTPVYSNTVRKDLSATPLKTGDAYQVDFPNFRPNMGVGDYKVKMYVNLLNATDNERRNDTIPKSSVGDYFMRVAYEFEASADQIVKPTGSLNYVGRPLRPVVKFSNNGVGDMPNPASANMVIKLNGDTVYTSLVTIPDIPSGNQNWVLTNFADFIPSVAGHYEICATFESPDDPVTGNNTICGTFDVIDALSGIYSIGTLNQGNVRNFDSISAAIDALYLQGMTGSVTFEFTDALYNVGNESIPLFPALDLSSKIVGLGSKYTLTFKPASNRATIRGGVTINLRSGNGIGVQFGQNDNPSNPNAPVSIVSDNSKKFYANSPGYIKFDGGNFKVFKFNLSTSSNFRATFYLRQGSSNITIKNCLIEDGNNQNPSYYFDLPNIKFDASLTKFTYEPDVRISGATYSAGIVLRATIPADGKTGTNAKRLDTIPCNTNIIQGNEITAFGYGIVSLGIGPLYYSNSSIPFDGYKRFYNYNNKIINNTITSVSRAGIFVGFEEATSISGNRIYSVSSLGGNSDAAGIIAGGDGESTNFGYNNVDLLISRNEINGVTNSFTTYGIKVEQNRLTFSQSSAGQSIINFPDKEENMRIVSNIVWGLAPAANSTHVFGIWLATERNITNPLAPRYGTYFTQRDKICNNTVFMDPDLMNNSGAYAGIALLQTKNAELKNNAIAIVDDQIDLTNDMAACVYYNGIMPGDGGFTSDRNAFFLGPNGSSLFRFTETNERSMIIESGLRNEYDMLAQWQSWTKQDLYSIVGNFTNEFVKVGYSPQNLRVNITPEPPVGSILNNRGERLSYITDDIDGESRGVAGLRFDIGADEFNGRMHVNDLEMMSFSAPATYQASTGTYNDAEYIMTYAPVDIKANVRNNGTLDQANAAVILNVYRENPDGSYSSSVLNDTAKTTIASGESAGVSFKLDDGIGKEFIPLTYGDLRPLYTGKIPKQFTTMEANVTPKYKVQVTLVSDQSNLNNTVTKYVRFYLKRSPLNFLVSSENSFEDYNTTPPPPTDLIAGRLNTDSVVQVFKRLGWYTDLNATPKRFDIDLFDRNGWEPKSTNYKMYRTVVWTDGDDKATSRYQIKDINAFLNNTSLVDKKNLIIASQEMLRQNESIDTNFTQQVLRAKRLSPIPNAQDNPLGFNVSNDGNIVSGGSIGRGMSQSIKQTIVSGDVPPYCGLVKVNLSGEGVARPALSYNSHTATPMDSLMGVATATLIHNVVYMAVDWRHFSDVENMIRACLDFAEKNGGIVPVELTDFTATQYGKKVNINWSTASELSSSHFVIEKSLFGNSGKSPFEAIADVKAAGKSNLPVNYGPIADYDVQYGSKYAYRLKMVSLDGTSELSDEKVLEIKSIDGNVQISQPMPNPANAFVRFDVTLDKESNVEMSIYDMSGKNIENVFNGLLQSGTTAKEFDIRNLSNGTYTLILRMGEITLSQNFTVLK
ncbi:MAG: hypothetical protein HW421_477 [Ignavibacteria bacterium]|nr:hypothetical protein [Ignavibacteria bacterium]